jgi:putative sigma-54 modulation protein
MKVNIQAVNFKADKKLVDFIEERLEKLRLFYDQIISSDIHLKLDQSEKDNKIAEVKIGIPGNDLFAKKQCKTFEESVDLCLEALIVQVKKHKAKLVK